MDAPAVDTASLERSDKTGLSDSTHTSASSASEKYRLDELDESPILLYKYRGGLQTSTQKDLCSWLDKGKPNARLACTTCTQLTSHFQTRTSKSTASPASPYQNTRLSSKSSATTSTCQRRSLSTKSSPTTTPRSPPSRSPRYHTGVACCWAAIQTST